MSNLLNYQTILEEAFCKFLLNQGASKKTQRNYRTDLHHFLNWVVLTIPTTTNHLLASTAGLLAVITPELLENYKRLLVENHVPLSTVNRRLSSVRAFCRACQAYGWLNHNPAASLQNLTKEKTKESQLEKILELFRHDLKHEGASKVTIKNYASDVKQFLTWLQNQ